APIGGVGGEVAGGPAAEARIGIEIVEEHVRGGRGAGRGRILDDRVGVFDAAARAAPGRGILLGAHGVVVAGVVNHRGIAVGGSRQAGRNAIGGGGGEARRGGTVDVVFDVRR